MQWKRGVKQPPERKVAGMKLEYELARREAEAMKKGKSEGRVEGKAEIATTLIQGMTDAGKGKQEIIAFLTHMLKLSPETAESYYRKAMNAQ